MCAVCVSSFGNPALEGEATKSQRLRGPLLSRQPAPRRVAKTVVDRRIARREGNRRRGRIGWPDWLRGLQPRVFLSAGSYSFGPLPLARRLSRRKQELLVKRVSSSRGLQNLWQVMPGSCQPVQEGHVPSVAVRARKRLADRRSGTPSPRCTLYSPDPCLKSRRRAGQTPNTRLESVAVIRSSLSLGSAKSNLLPFVPFSPWWVLEHSEV